MKKVYTKEDFINLWGDGYIEPFIKVLNYNYDQETIYDVAIKPFINDKKTCLEIGCGGGIWANKLINDFLNVIAIDVIPKSRLIDDRIIYYELNSCDYTCAPITDNSIDFVWSYGVFCHLPNSAINDYIKNIYRVLKIGGDAVIMFADWDEHPQLKDENNVNNYKETVHEDGWFYMNKKIIKKTLTNNGITDYNDLLPNFRDRLIHFKK